MQISGQTTPFDSLWRFLVKSNAGSKDRLWEICQQFVKDNEIGHPETIYQSDRVIERSYRLVEKICDIVGYHEFDESEK